MFILEKISTATNKRAKPKCLDYLSMLSISHLMSILLDPSRDARYVI